MKEEDRERERKKGASSRLIDRGHSVLALSALPPSLVSHEIGDMLRDLRRAADDTPSTFR